MSEGTMQRRAQRDQSGRRAKGLTRVLVGAAGLPVLLVATACSSGSGSDSGYGDGDKASAAASASASPSPTVRPAAFQKLPEPCHALKKDTLEDLVPKAKSGKEGTSDDVTVRGSCSWSSLDNNGVKGSQFRWLNVSLLRFESNVTRGAGDDLAKKYYAKQVRDAQSVEGARDHTSEPASGIGDEATTVRYGLKKKEGTFKQQTVVARVENVVVTVDYNGAGLAGEKTPDAGTLVKAAQKAAKEAVAAVESANDPAGGGKDASGKGSKSSKSPSAKSPSASKSATAGRSSKSPSKKG
ncbi:DUF3558 family protein [Streptomyces sp. NPDC005925]|uniref:DUF3558 family protein n=1 Tax=Streptomyces sp. NPDC005925 TaxID=3157172 RepID=UPI0033F9E5A5